MARSKYVRVRKSGSKTKSKSTILFKKELVNNADIAVAAGEYYDKHKTTIDNALSLRTRSPYDQRTNKEIFVDLANDEITNPYLKTRYGTKRTANRAFARIVDDIRGLDPRIKEIKRDAEGREQAGFKDLRKLNRKVEGIEINYSYGDIIGYFDIAGSEYVIAHSRVDAYNTGSPIDVYEYVTRSSIGLPTA